MRHRWMCLPMIGLLCLLGGCGGGGEPSADELALQIRGEYLSMEGFTARVELAELMGAESYLYLSAGGRSLTARVPARLRAAAGEEISLALDSNKIHLFDKNTQLRLGS